MRTRVTAAELVRHFGQWQEQAMLRPVYVTHHGRDRLVLLSIANYTSMGVRARALESGIEAAGPTATEPLLEQLAEGFVAFDRGLRVIEMNPAAAAYLRLTRAESIGEKLFERLEGMRRSLMHGHLVRALESGEIGAFDLPSTAYEGRWLHVRTFAYGEGAACLMRDVTEEMNNRRLADTKQTMRRAMSAHGGIGIAKLSPRGTFTEVDETLSGMAGFAPETLMRARLTDILPLNRRVSAAREVEAVLTGATARAFDSALLVNSGEERPVRIALAELRGDYASDGAMVVVTPRAETEEAG